MALTRDYIQFFLARFLFGKQQLGVCFGKWMLDLSARFLIHWWPTDFMTEPTYKLIALLTGKSNCRYRFAGLLFQPLCWITRHVWKCNYYWHLFGLTLFEWAIQTYVHYLNMSYSKRVHQSTNPGNATFIYFQDKDPINHSPINSRPI